jgi:hypothetical protein
MIRIYSEKCQPLAKTEYKFGRIKVLTEKIPLQKGYRVTASTFPFYHLVIHHLNKCQRFSTSTLALGRCLFVLKESVFIVELF